MKKLNCSELKEAVLKVFGDKILQSHDAHSLARSVFAYVAVETGVPIAEVADALRSTHAGVMNCRVFCSNLLANHDTAAEEAVRAVNAIVGNIGCRIVAKAETCGSETFTEISADGANVAQRLVLTLAAWNLHGTVIGTFKKLYVLPVAPDDERVQTAIECVNSLADATGADAIDEVISELFKSSYRIG